VFAHFIDLDPPVKPLDPLTSARAKIGSNLPDPGYRQARSKRLIAAIRSTRWCLDSAALPVRQGLAGHSAAEHQPRLRPRSDSLRKLRAEGPPADGELHPAGSGV